MLAMATLLAAASLAAQDPGAGSSRPGVRSPAPPSAGVKAGVVHRGEHLVLSARVGAVIASMEVEALQDGDVGELIQVRSLHNGRLHRVRVVRTGNVEVLR